VRRAIYPGSTDGIFSGGSHKQVTFGQLHTGQGKTLIAAMVAIYIKALTHAAGEGQRIAIGILTTNSVLTRQNYAETKDIFKVASKAIGVKLKVVVFDPDEKGAEDADIIYINPFDLSRDYANFYRSDEREPMLPWHIQDNIDDPKFKSAIVVDEVDAILYDGVGETYLSVRVLPYSEKLAMVARRIAETCSEQKDFSGAELHRLLGLNESQPVRHDKHFETSVCEDPVEFENLKEEIEHEVSIAPSKLARKQERKEIGKVSRDQIDAAGWQVLGLLANDRMYSIADTRRHKTLSSLYEWVVDIFETRMGKGKGRAHVNVNIRNGRVGQLEPVLDWIPSGIGCEEERNDYDLCTQYRVYVKSQLLRWMKEARNLLGSQPMLVQNRNYILRGAGLCAHAMNENSPFALPKNEMKKGGSCLSFATSLMCNGEMETDLGRDKMAEIKTRACANHWLNKIAEIEDKNDVIFDAEKLDIRTRIMKLLGMMSGGEASKVTDIRREVSFSQVIYVQHVSGTIRERTRFNGFKHLFLEYKHNGAVITGPSSETVALSRIRAMENFDIVLGFTGTLPKQAPQMPQQDKARYVLQQREHSMFVQILKHLYGAGEYRPRLVYVESFVESRMTIKSRVAASNDDDKWNKVMQEIGITQTTHCSLVVVQDIGTALHIAEVLSESAEVFQFTGDGRDEDIAAMNFEAGQVVVTTAVGSRGVDWKCHAPGGFEVIATFMSKSVRVQRQIQGRAGRSGQKGSYIEIVTEAEVTQSLKEWGESLGHIVRLVKGSLENDMRTDCIQQLSDKIKSVASASGKNAEYKKRFDRFRLWLSDARYSQLSKGLKTLIKGHVDGSPEESKELLVTFFMEFASDLISDAKEPLSVDTVIEKIDAGILEHKLAFEYLFDEVASNAAYKQFISECVEEGECTSIPDFSIA